MLATRTIMNYAELPPMSRLSLFKYLAHKLQRLFLSAHWLCKQQLQASTTQHQSCMKSSIHPIPKAFGLSLLCPQTFAMAQLASRLSTGICPVTSLQVPDRDFSGHGLVTRQDKSDWKTVSRVNDLTLQTHCQGLRIADLLSYLHERRP